MCSLLIPSVTEKSVIFIKEQSFPQTAPTDDAFFSRNWAGARRGRWAGPGLLVGRGCRILDRRGWGRTTAAMLDCRLWVGHFSAKTRKRGSARASSVAAPMPKSVAF